MTKTEFALQLVSQRYRDYLIADLQLTNSVIRALREGSAIEDVAELLDTSVEDVRDRLTRTSVELDGGTLTIESL